LYPIVWQNSSLPFEMLDWCPSPTPMKMCTMLWKCFSFVPPAEGSWWHREWNWRHFTRIWNEELKNTPPFSVILLMIVSFEHQKFMWNQENIINNSEYSKMLFSVHVQCHNNVCAIIPFGPRPLSSLQRLLSFQRLSNICLVSPLVWFKHLKFILCDLIMHLCDLIMHYTWIKVKFVMILIITYCDWNAL